MQTTCGVYILNNKNELLICHQTNYKNFNGWSIPKGLNEVDESYIETAIREVKEETSIELDLLLDEFKILPISIYKSKKKQLISYLYLTQIDSEKVELECTSYFEYKGKQIKENDKFRWVNIFSEELPYLLHEAQVNNWRLIRYLINKNKLLN